MGLDLRIWRLWHQRWAVRLKLLEAARPEVKAEYRRWVEYLFQRGVSMQTIEHRQDLDDLRIPETERKALLEAYLERRERRRRGRRESDAG